MTVKELVEQLQKYDDDRKVFAYFDCHTEEIDEIVISHGELIIC